MRLTADGRVAAAAAALPFAHAFESHPGALSFVAEPAWAALVADAIAVFPADGSFWLASDAAPRCALEAVARAVFAHHTRGLPRPLPAELRPSGAEWWVQVRRDGDSGDGSGGSPTASSVAFHTDKDEDLVDEGGPLIHPAVSTVTYLSCGPAAAPTVIVSLSQPLPPTRPAKRPRDGGAALATARSCFLSHAERGKSIAFEGRFLHGAPRALAPAGPAAVVAAPPRVTLLVNVWLGWKPLGLDPLPVRIISQLRLQPAAAAPRVAFLPRTGARPRVLLGGGGAASDEVTFEQRFGETARGEWAVSIPLPRAALAAEGPDDGSGGGGSGSSVRVEYPPGSGVVVRRAGRERGAAPRG